MTETKWLDDDEARAWRSLQFMQMRLESELARQLAADSTLSLQDYAVLVALTDRDDGRLRAFELAATLGWDKTRLSHHVKRMIDRGLVKKESCPSDRRGFFIAVTDQGRREIEDAAPAHVDCVRSCFIDLVSREELAVITAVTERVLANFSDPIPD
jgi:DNA-binding MarR family transcriptional regulator